MTDTLVTKTGDWYSNLLPLQVSKTLLSAYNQSPDSHFESSIVTTLRIPMPTPGTPTTPYFKGKRIEDFLDSLEQHADSVSLVMYFVIVTQKCRLLLKRDSVNASYENEKTNPSSKFEDIVTPVH
ncbi:uncharacterized protein LACBIDRAFT_322422 [Laccaria bicolor S238N-H82]|uniref:Predicted protein n=1 Tax=Laccaria bicolor (strain S238N-H82 / ATCC MYA-4686) TaxID=486041 RepID=B0CW84_LACBS|nr:uncharacterized protein LACBIDRAFT_322422 [Laccaria bicolor S238N-H82]EDR13463.1 predicted protein [Laccaria bicolor S238N-H82]|eukprot:XP_001875961.1 predicted protein [Laccaria bicolor S238N-H82]